MDRNHTGRHRGWKQTTWLRRRFGSSDADVSDTATRPSRIISVRDLSSETTKRESAPRRHGCGAARRRDQYRHWLSWLPGTAAPADRRTDRTRTIASVTACVCVRVMSCGCVTAYWTVNTSFKLSLVLLDGFANRLNNNSVNNKQFPAVRLQACTDEILQLARTSQSCTLDSLEEGTLPSDRQSSSTHHNEINLFTCVYELQKCTSYWHMLSSCLGHFDTHKARRGNNFAGVCIPLCMYVYDNESLDVQSSFLVCSDILRGYASSSYTKVIGSRSRSQQQNSCEIPFPVT